MHTPLVVVSIVEKTGGPEREHARFRPDGGPVDADKFFYHIAKNLFEASRDDPDQIVFRFYRPVPE